MTRKSIWPSSSSVRVDRSLRAHSVIGLAVSAILFIVCLSGVLAVFEDELGWWELPETPAVTSVSPEAAQRAIETAAVNDPETEHVYLYLPRDNWPRFVVGTDNGLHTANAEGELVGGYETAWNDFLIHLHYYLHLPETFGMMVVALTGIVLLAMSVSGLLAHPRIFRDAFRFRRKGSARLVQADLHNRMSVWTAPFHIVIAATGAMIGLFVVIAYVLALTSYGGDSQALTRSIFGSEPEADSTPAPMAQLDRALAAMPDIAPDAPPFLVVVHDPGTLGQHIGIYGEHTDRLIYGETYAFDGEGSYTGHEGASDGELGQQIAMSVYRAHFGDIGGLPMKFAYFVLGLILCVIIASGMNIYFVRSADQGKARPKMEAAWSGLVWGTSCLFALTLGLALLGLSGAALTPVFWMGTILIMLASAIWGQVGRAGNVLRFILGVLLILVPAIHIILHADTYANLYIWLPSLVLCLSGIGFLAYAVFGSSALIRQKSAAA